MKILAATKIEGGIKDELHHLFGRCDTFTLIKMENSDIEDVKVIKNLSSDGSSGAGVKAAQFAVDEMVDYAMAGNFGPNAESILKKSGIVPLQYGGITVEAAIKEFLKEDKDYNNNIVR